MKIPTKPKRKDRARKWHDDIQRAKLWPEYSGWVDHSKPKGIPALFGGRSDNEQPGKE